MSVFNNPKEWADEMNRIMARLDIINKDNYLTDLANAVVYVRETADKNEKLEAKVKELESLQSIPNQMRIDRSDEAWYKLIGKIGSLVNCLPSSFATDNQHIVRKVEELQKKVKELEEQVLDIVEGVVGGWVLWGEQDDTFDSMAITSIMEKMELLEQHGRFEILKQHGRRAIGKFIEQPKEGKV